MIGYHYTSLDCWGRIKVEGLIPYPLTHPGVTENPNVPRRGIWVYCRRQDLLSHEACLVWQATAKNTNSVVLLEVQYHFEDRISPDGRFTVSVDHDLYDDNGVYHVREPAHLLFNRISPEDIRLLEVHRNVPPKQTLPVCNSLKGRSERDVERRREICAATWQRFVSNPKMLRAI